MSEIFRGLYFPHSYHQDMNILISHLVCVIYFSRNQIVVIFDKDRIRIYTNQLYFSQNLSSSYGKIARYREEIVGESWIFRPKFLPRSRRKYWKICRKFNSPKYLVINVAQCFRGLADWDVFNVIIVIGRNHQGKCKAAGQILEYRVYINPGTRLSC